MNTPPAKPSDVNDVAGRAAPVSSPVGAHAPHDDTFDFWRTAHRALRGRYAIALLMAGVCGIAGAWAGSRFGQRMYSATGLVRIASVLPQVMKETDQNRPIAMFDGIIDAQREVMTSRETIHAAMQEPSWIQAAFGEHVLSEDQFAAGLKVETRPRSDHLKVIFKHKDPSIVAAAVRSVISVYQRSYTAEQQKADNLRMAQLQSRRVFLRGELNKLRENLGPGPQSTEEVEPLYQAASERVRKLRILLSETQFAMAGGPDTTLPQIKPAQTPGQVADEELLRTYAAELARVEIQLAHGRSRGLGPLHPDIVWLTSMAKECRDNVAKYTKACEARMASGRPEDAPVTLADRKDNLERLVQTADEEMTRLVARRNQLKAFEEQTTTLRQALAETESRQDALALEASQGSRLTVISNGTRATTTTLDNRGKSSALGALVGMTLPMGFMVLRAARHRRYRFCDEVAADMMDRVPLVAVLPDVHAAKGLGAAAGHSIHDLRVRLQPRDHSDKRTYLITSVTSGEGKSSVALALGLSFAAAGYKTLLIDTDLTSRRLTKGFNADDQPGVIEALAGKEPSLRWTHCGLSFLPAGCPGVQDTGMIAPAATRALLSTLRERYDVVLIDSDAILTGLAACVVAPNVDGVVLTLAHGQEQGLTRKAVRQIQMLGAVTSAAVFNRADVADFRAILTDQSLNSVRDRVISPKLGRFGPLVNAALSSLSLTRDRDLDLMPPGMSLANPDEDRTGTAADRHGPESVRREAA